MNNENRSLSRGFAGNDSMGLIRRYQYNASMIPIYWSTGNTQGQPWPLYNPNGQPWPQQGHAWPAVVPQSEALAPQVAHQDQVWPVAAPQGQTMPTQGPQQGYVWPTAVSQGQDVPTQGQQQGQVWPNLVPQSQLWPIGAYQNQAALPKPEGSLPAAAPPAAAATFSSSLGTQGARPRHRRHSKSKSVAKGSGGDQGAKRKPRCVFCSTNGEEEVWHVFKDEEGNVLCPVLSAYKCRLCGATGKKAHTLKYCPKNKITKGDPVAAGLPPGLMPSHIKVEDIY